MSGRKRFRYLRHTGDLSVEVFGRNLVELISNAVYATASVLHGVRDLKCGTIRNVDYKFTDEINLMVQILSDVVYYLEIEDILFFRVISADIRHHIGEFTLCGHSFTREYTVRNVIKAVTYHGMSIDPSKGKASIMFDI